MPCQGIGLENQRWKAEQNSFFFSLNTENFAHTTLTNSHPALRHLTIVFHFLQRREK